jgi:hypothetical protein
MRASRRNYWTGVLISYAALCLSTRAATAQAQQRAVTAQIEISQPSSAAHPEKVRTGTDASGVVVWLTPLDPPIPGASAPPRENPTLIQRNKTFEPHVLAIQAGSVVEFPNQDPFLHNVFSLFDGKRFDLGFYEAGSSRSVHFERVGVSFLFCNIHPEMSAVVVAVDSPYFGVSDRAGRVAIRNVPDGRYRMQVWYERSSADDLQAQAHVVTIAETARELPNVRLVENPNFTLGHKNKYGQDYAPPAAEPTY